MSKIIVTLLRRQSSFSAVNYGKNLRSLMCRCFLRTDKLVIAFPYQHVIEIKPNLEFDFRKTWIDRWNANYTRLSYVRIRVCEFVSIVNSLDR